MSVRQPTATSERAFVTVSEMARMVGLSRSRFYALMEQGIFPPPAHLVSTRRPVYPQRLQQACLEVRQSGIGWHGGQPVIFYGRSSQRRAPTPKPRAERTPPRSRRKRRADPRISSVMESLRALGMEGLRSSQVAAAVAEVFPDGFDGVEEGEIIRAVFRHLRGSDAPDKPTR